MPKQQATWPRMIALVDMNCFFAQIEQQDHPFWRNRPVAVTNGKQGSTIRMDYKAKQPGQYALYFNCKSKLVDTFRELYGDRFQFEGNRAIIFGLNDTPDMMALSHCISLSLNYHKIKHLPLLGA